MSAKASSSSNLSHFVSERLTGGEVLGAGLLNASVSPDLGLVWSKESIPVFLAVKKLELPISTKFLTLMLVTAVRFATFGLTSYICCLFSFFNFLLRFNVCGLRFIFLALCKKSASSLLIAILFSNDIMMNNRNHHRRAL